jgi:hypothetical protein
MTDDVHFDERMTALGGWRAEKLTQAREVIRAADPDVVEAVKWIKPSNPNGVLEWSHAGGICTGEVYKDKIKLTFHKGASLADPSGLFNSSLDGNVRRAVDFYEADVIDTAALADLVRAAVVLNETTKKR